MLKVYLVHQMWAVEHIFNDVSFIDLILFAPSNRLWAIRALGFVIGTTGLVSLVNSSVSSLCPNVPRRWSWRFAKMDQKMLLLLVCLFHHSCLFFQSTASLHSSSGVQRSYRPLEMDRSVSVHVCVCVCDSEGSVGWWLLLSDQLGAGRDSDIELLVLCNHWLSTLDKALVSFTFDQCGT